MIKLIICSTLLLVAMSSAFAVEKTPLEHPVTLIPLAPPLDDPEMEYSGLTWCGDKLFLLPQYPERQNPNEPPRLYYLSKSDIESFLAGQRSEPLKAHAVILLENEIRDRMTFFDGYEGVACDGSTLWLSIEAISLLGSYQAYIVPAELFEAKDSGLSVSVRTDQIRYVASQSGIRNKGDEAILLDSEHLISLHEINDPRAVSSPKANRVHAVNGEQSSIDFPHLPYRITDASAKDEQNRFWVINYKYSGDRFSRDADDSLADTYGLGASHQIHYNLERLVEYQILSNAIVRTDRAPIQLKLEGKEGRNWEGLVRLNDDGFLLITDKHPKTLLGFVSATPPASNE